MTDKTPSLRPQQICFIVDDVPAAVAFCQQRFGWGPFYQFKAPVDNASYKDWQGKKLTEVALGMAGKVQVEFLHVHYGHDTTSDYQTHYGVGFQHLGIHCKSREAAIAHLESLGASVNERNEYPGIRFAFMDVPTGLGMFELLESTAELSADIEKSADQKGAKNQTNEALIAIDRATIVTDNIDHSLAFYCAAFGWQNIQSSTATLRYNNQQVELKRAIGQAGTLELEIIEANSNGDDPYAKHLQRGEHGLIHAGGIATQLPAGGATQGEWLETGEVFTLYDWAGGKQSLQFRLSIT